jgi:acetyl-CoA acetyltransferase
MPDVYLAGVGVVPFGKYEGVEEADLVLPALRAAVQDAGLEERAIDAVFFANVFAPAGIGQRTLWISNLVGKPIINIENACASGTNALLEAIAWIKAEMADIALVVGVEILTGRLNGLIPLPAGDNYAEQGLTLPALYALKARHHMECFGSTREQFARVSVKNRRHAVFSDIARFREAVSLDEVLASRPIADPLTLLQCCPNADGAAAVIVASARALRMYGARKPVRVAGSAIASGLRRQEIGWDEVTLKQVAQLAYERAAIGPDDIDVAEVHDAFTPGELLAYERLGFSEEGMGGIDLEQGRFHLGGTRPIINPSGGLLARGHPPGATGLAQVREIMLQLRDEAGPRQYEGARVGMTVTMGGTATQLETNACVVHILTI